MNGAKRSLAESLATGALSRAREEIRATGKALPCSVVSVQGAIVTVKFEIQDSYTLPHIAMPVMGSRYIRLPLRAGDKGVAIPADSTIGHISGLGVNAAPKLAQSGNLSALMFMPIGDSHWAAVDADAVVISAPNGVVLQDDSGASKLTLSPAAAILADAVHNLSPGHAFTVFALVELWLNSHTHNAAGVPTSPPIAPYTGGNIAG